MNHLLTHTNRVERSQLMRWFNDAIHAMQPGTRFLQDVHLHQENLLLPDGRTLSLRNYRKIWLFGAGKGAFSLAEGVIAKLGNRISGGAVIGTVDSASQPGVPQNPGTVNTGRSSVDLASQSGAPQNGANVQFLPGDHPLPLDNSVKSTDALLSVAQQVSREDLVLFVLTGGASAMLCKPAPTVTLAFKQQRFRELLDSGASIHTINAARKALSMVKGGGLLNAFSGADVLNFIVSDVPGDDLQTIGSAPTQPSSAQPYAGKVINCLLATPGQTTRLVGEYARGDGYTIHVQEQAYSETVEQVVRAIHRDILEAKESTDAGIDAIFKVPPDANKDVSSDVRRNAVSDARKGAIHHTYQITDAHSKAQTYPKLASRRGNVLIYFGESEVHVQGNGKGGRNQHLALLLALALEGFPHKVTVLSAGTDGVDGNTDAAGAICTESTALFAREKGLNPKEFLRNFDSHSFFKQIGDIFITGPTGTNFADLQIVIVH